jgi:hypothetical protein
LDYTSLQSLAGDLGQIGDGHGRGYECHNVLAVAEKTGEVLGLLDQILHHRDDVPEKESLTERRNRETRESLLWVRGTQHLPADVRLIDVADQGAGTFEFLEHESKSGRRFVIRDGKVRKVSAGHTAASRSTGYLKTHARGLPELGRFTMDVQAQAKRAARKQAEFIVRGDAVLVWPPHAKAGHHGNQPLALWVVLVTEVQPPPREKPIEWLLLTNEPVTTLDDAWRVIAWYERRWIIEEYHKAKKTGCQIEDLQFTSTQRLEPAIALLSVVAITLLNLRAAARQPDAKERQATELFAPEYVEVLSAWRYQTPRHDLTIHEFFFALARLGGHQNRKRDHRPGWLVLWRGWTKLQAMLEGYEAAQRKRCG